MKKNVQIGRVLVEKGCITEEQLQSAVDAQKQMPGKRLGDILLELNYVSEATMAEALAEQLNLPFVDLRDYRIDPKAVALVERDYAEQRSVIPVGFQNGALVVAASDPLALYTFEELYSMTGYDVSTVVATKTAVKQAIERWYSGAAVSTAASDLDREFANVAADAELTLADDRVEGTPVAKLVNAMIVQAASVGASDIHIEPTKDALVIRTRINGDLLPRTTMKMAAHNAITTRIKLLSDMNIAEKRLPQDGKFHFASGPLELDVRTSSLPTIYGEKLVLRLLGGTLQRDLLKLERLGLAPGMLAEYQEMLRAPNGIILVTGPTGSGKTTTLYATLHQMAERASNIITIEDPVEERLDHINQVQVNSKAGLTFASALRSILRQDPDIIMVGEMRDTETATLGIRAAITGHLVFSTLHANDTMSSIARLVDMGVAPYMVAAAMTGVVAQRLVKVLCPSCKQKHPVSQRDHIILGEEGADIEEVYSPVGCPHCNGTGYIGRRPVYEVVRVDGKLRDMINRGASTGEMKEYEKSRGVKFLHTGAVELVRSGDTSVEEMEKIAYSIE